MAGTRRGSRRPAPITLVVGDWLIDEYWFLVQHDSEVSAHAGSMHYRVANQISEGAADLCGAGHVARMLVNLRKQPTDYRIWGVGDWHESDTNLLKHLLHPRAPAGEELAIDCDAVKAWYWLTPSLCDKPPDVELVTLHPNNSTTRIIRQYHHEHGGLEQINRIDWEPEEVHNREPHDLSRLPGPRDVTRIVVQDYKKGAVDDRLVTLLRDKYPKARWYVRSKVNGPSWLELIKDRIELIVVGPEVATRENPWHTLLVNNTINPSALETVQTLPGKLVVLLSERLEVVAVSREGQHSCVTGQSYLSTLPVLQVGWVSVFFGAMVHFLSMGKKGKPLVDAALDTADRFGTIAVPKTLGMPPPIDRKPFSRATPWRDETEKWNAASSYANCGVIGKAPNEELHVWRASPYLSNYIAVIRKKQQIINEIGRTLRDFKYGLVRRSISILLQADPGSGKTFLARALAESFGFTFLPADVSQMAHRDELFGLFEQIATQQANDRNRLLVFVDEFNSELEGGNVYSAFLSPLEEGVFVSRGKRFSMKPCAWIFAGTETAVGRDGKAGKLADLTSRLSMTKRIDYEYLEKEMVREKGTAGERELAEEAALEQVYLGAAMIRRYYADVRSVAYDVLESFRTLEPKDGGAPRRIRKLIESMKDVQYGRITRANCSWLAPSNASADRMVRLAFA